MPRTFGVSNAQLYSSAPAVGVAGAQYFNSTNRQFYISDGTNWVAMAPQLSIGASPPSAPVIGQLWWRNDPDGVLFTYYNDGSSAQWVPVTPVKTT